MPRLAPADELLATVERLALRNDPALEVLSRGNDVSAALTELEARTTTSVWNMQRTAQLSVNRVAWELDSRARAKGIEERVLYDHRAARNFPLLTSIEPTARIGTVPFPVLVADGRYALLPGPTRPGYSSTTYGTADSDLVRMAGAAFCEAWSTSKAWGEAGLRPPLPQRRFQVAVLVTDGLTDREIAAELGIGPRTVSAEVRAVVDWLGARNRTHAVAMLVGAA